MAKMYLDSGGAATNSGTSDNASPDLSGSANATVVSNSTFVDADVNTATDIVTIATHGFTSGSGVELTTTGTLPAGLTLTTLYYLFAVDANNLTFHTNVADAEAGTNPVNITAAAGGGTHTINNYTINLGGSPNLSAVNGHHCRVTTTGTSHVISMAGSVHGLTTGDAVFLSVFTGGTVPGGMSTVRTYFVNVLSSTTFRIYSTLALALAGGVSGINVSSAEVRTLSVFTEVAAAINLVSSSVTNRKIFWVRSVSDTNNLVIVDQVVTGLGAGSDWAIGGSVTAAGAVDLFNSQRGGDEIIFNTDISGAINASNRILASQVGPGNFIAVAQAFITGKAGARRGFVNTGNGTLFNPGVGTVLFDIRNMEFQSQGTGATISSSNNHNTLLYDCVVSDGGAPHRFGFNGTHNFCVRSRIGGVSGVDFSNSILFLVQSYIHDVTGDGLTTVGNCSLISIGSIIERCSDRIIEQVSATTVRTFNILIGNTFYRADNSGYEETSAINYLNTLIMLDNIFKDNGNASTEANIELLLSARRCIIDKDNVFSIDGARGGVNALGYTLDASDLTSDPLFVDPDAAAGSRNFGLQSGSPAKGIPYTFPGSLSISYRDLGAVQSQAVAGGGGMLAANMRGNMQ